MIPLGGRELVDASHHVHISTHRNSPVAVAGVWHQRSHAFRLDQAPSPAGEVKLVRVALELSKHVVPAVNEPGVLDLALAVVVARRGCRASDVHMLPHVDVVRGNWARGGQLQPPHLESVRGGRRLARHVCHHAALLLPAHDVEVPIPYHACCLQSTKGPFTFNDELGPGEREHVEDVDVVQVDVLVLRLGFGVKHGVAPDGALLLVHAPEEHHPLAV
mmetsp:Transcript_5396/g.10167  ORF Transcript_5396/g.10167 Transcript_5396/m.10167 type:complete len:218 (-) Transcript_5396:931-1584(-)